MVTISSKAFVLLVLLQILSLCRQGSCFTITRRWHGANLSILSGGRGSHSPVSTTTTTTTINKNNNSGNHRCRLHQKKVPDGAISLSSSKEEKKRNLSLILSSSAAFLAVAGLILWKRHAILTFLDFVKNQWLIKSLDRLAHAGLAGVILYIIIFMVWEMTAGITTPVETAAGMVFGPVIGVVASGLGKTLGALSAFFLSRYIFYDKVHEHIMGGNDFLELMEESIEETPLRVALLCRFSPLPELVKNCGMGVLPVQRRWFLASLLLHGFSFTCLWTFMGAETAAVLRGCPPSPKLKVLVSGATWIGFGSPVLIGMWIKSLKDKQRRRKEEGGGGGEGEHGRQEKGS